ncbi:hypothetical protein FPV67DRAFT_1673288 [Lyophyllum atratum]|nr:hypothetical protein FPV67DRAFT_1673288 [Lyophyllum atratum]
MFDYLNHLPFIGSPVDDVEANNLLEPLDLFNDEDSDGLSLEIFYTPFAESLLFSGSVGLPPLTEKVAFWSGSSFQAFEEVDDTLVGFLGQGKLELPLIDENDPDVVDVATPHAKRVPLPLQLATPGTKGSSLSLLVGQGGQTSGCDSSPRTPTFSEDSPPSLDDMFDYLNHLPFIGFPVDDDEASNLLDPLDLFNDDSDSLTLEIFYIPAAESLLFSGTVGLPPLNEKVAFWSGSSLTAFEEVDDALVGILGQGKLELSFVDEDVRDIDPDIVDVATPQSKRVPLSLQLAMPGAKGSSLSLLVGQGGQASGCDGSPRTPTFRLATGSPRVQNFSLLNSPNLLAMFPVRRMSVY